MINGLSVGSRGREKEPKAKAKEKISGMIMVPSQNFCNQQQQFYDGYGGCGDTSNYTDSICFMNRLVGYDYYYSTTDTTCLGFDLVVGPMAEDQSRTSSINEAAGSSSKDLQEERDDSRWLQLGLGGYMTNPQYSDGQAEPTTRKSGSIELHLLPAGDTSHSQHMRPAVPTFHLSEYRAPRPATSTSSSMGIPTMTNISTPMFLQHPRTSSLSFPQQEVTWGYRPHSWNPTGVASSSSNPLRSYQPRPFQLQSLGAAVPSSTMRVIDPPRRPHSNIWFSLQASQNQSKEPFLPQIPRSYLRIKDGRMTVRVLMKYLVSKLGLSSESEVEITCRGQQVSPFLTLQHVRDTIWKSSRDAVVTLLSDSSTTDHIMTLHYGRSIAA